MSSQMLQAGSEFPKPTLPKVGRGWCGKFVHPVGFFVAILFPTLFGVAGNAANSTELSFDTHAAFFSQETHQPKPIDPHVFVGDTSSSAGIGPQNIRHVAGIRPAFIDQDSKNSPLLNAEGRPLDFDLGQWLAAKGRVTITVKSDGKAQISAMFQNLRPGGHYSLFENHFDQQPIGFTPLDGTGATNNFVASATGTAQISVIAPKVPTHANAVLLVFHSDGQEHGTQRGEIGVNAHHQLIARIPQ